MILLFCFDVVVIVVVVVVLVVVLVVVSVAVYFYPQRQWLLKFSLPFKNTMWTIGWGWLHDNDIPS